MSVCLSKGINFIIGKELCSCGSSKFYSGLMINGIQENVIKVLTPETKYKIKFDESFICPIISQPNIAEISEIGVDGDKKYQVLDINRPTNLGSYLQSHLLTNQQKLEIADQVLSAVEFLHHHLICLQNIRLDNILIDQLRKPYIVDFSSANFAYKPLFRLNSPNYHETPYQAPEIQQNKEYNGLLADVWNVGIFLYSFFAEKMPIFENQMILSDLDTLPKEIVEIIQVCLVPPSQRPSITTLRSNPIFNSIQNRVENRDCFYDFVNINPNNNLEHVFYISMHSGIPYEKVLSSLNSKELNSFKIVYSLLDNERSENKMKNNAERRRSRRTAISGYGKETANSLPHFSPRNFF